jgi:hypothetical protein
MAVEDKIETLVRGAGAAVERMSRNAIWKSLTEWRSSFASEVESETGRATHLGYEWHAFSYGFSRASEGQSAVQAAMEHSPSEYLVLSAWTDVQFGFRCQGPLPDLGAMRVDTIIVDADMSWTLVFTHEPGVGPFYASRGPR